MNGTGVVYSSKGRDQDTPVGLQMRSWSVFSLPSLCNEGPWLRFLSKVEEIYLFLEFWARNFAPWLLGRWKLDLFQHTDVGLWFGVQKQTCGHLPFNIIRGWPMTTPYRVVSFVPPYMNVYQTTYYSLGHTHVERLLKLTRS
jgi:hypothetical protein